MRIKPILLGGVLLLSAAGFFWLRTHGLFVNAEEGASRNEIKRLTERRDKDRKDQTILAAGEFHDLARTGAGQVNIYADGVGKRYLEFIELETAPGKDLCVCLMPSNDSQTTLKADYTAYIVAPLPAITGDQLYELPSKVDLSRCKAVVIWSRNSGVNFAKAALWR